MARRVGRDRLWFLELAVAFATRTKLRDIFTFFVELLDAVVESVGHQHLPARGNSDTTWPIELTITGPGETCLAARRADLEFFFAVADSITKRQHEFAVFLELIDPVVPGIHNEQVSTRRDRYALGFLELPDACSFFTELCMIFIFRIELLYSVVASIRDPQIAFGVLCYTIRIFEFTVAWTFFAKR